MFCDKCNKQFTRRAAFVVHLTQCLGREGEEEDNSSDSFSYVDESDADPLFTPEDDYSFYSSDHDSKSSPLSAEQSLLSKEVEELLIECPNLTDEDLEQFQNFTYSGVPNLNLTTPRLQRQDPAVVTFPHQNPTQDPATTGLPHLNPTKDPTDEDLEQFQNVTNSGVPNLNLTTPRLQRQEPAVVTFPHQNPTQYPATTGLPHLNPTKDPTDEDLEQFQNVTNSGVPNLNLTTPVLQHKNLAVISFPHKNPTQDPATTGLPHQNPTQDPTTTGLPHLNPTKDPTDEDLDQFQNVTFSGVPNLNLTTPILQHKNLAVVSFPHQNPTQDPATTGLPNLIPIQDPTYEDLEQFHNVTFSDVPNLNLTTPRLQCHNPTVTCFLHQYPADASSQQQDLTALGFECQNPAVISFPHQNPTHDPATTSLPHQNPTQNPTTAGFLNHDPVVARGKKQNGKRVWDKRDCCIYCEKIVTNFSRHVFRNHYHEPDVVKILSFPKSSKERKHLIDVLRKKGNFFNNTTSLHNNAGKIIVVHRPTNEKPVSDYLPCKMCLGFFSRKRLYRHMKVCKSKTPLDHSKNAQGIGSTLLLNNTEPQFSDLKEKIFPIMRYDIISDTVKNDHLILQYGARMLKKHQEVHMKTVISQKMRELGRLAYHLKSKYPEMKQLKEFLVPDHYHKVVESVQHMAGFNPCDRSFKLPSLATKLGHSLKSCSEILECNGIVKKDLKLTEKAKQFHRLLSINWKFDISSNALKSMEEAKWNKPLLLPLAGDIKLLHTYLTNKAASLGQSLKLNPSEILWKELSEVTLVQIILLNRRRSGETERIKVSSYQDRVQSEFSDIEQTLSDVEKTLCKSLTRFEIRGKKGRGVPVLLTPLMKSSLDLLIQTRGKANINPDNPFLFAIPYKVNSCMRGPAVLRKYSKLCGAKYPTNLTSTRLRKHVATMSQLLDISDNDLEHLATFMGHDIAVHRQYYRLPENTMQVAKISKILLALESGKLKSLSGQTLESINVETPISDEDTDEENLTPNNLEGEDKLAENVVSPEHPSESHTPRQKKIKRIEPLKDVDRFAEEGLHTEEPDDCLTVPDNITKGRKMKKSVQKRPWSEQEKEALKKHFSKHIIMKKVPNKAECCRCLSLEPFLASRSWSNLKFQVKNMFLK